MSGTQTSVTTPVFGLVDTAELVGVVRNLKLPSKFLLDTFFPNIVESDAEMVAIDVDNGKRRMSPFCSPLVEGTLVESRQWQTNLFKPAYIKDKRVPDLLRPVRRAIGERLLGGALSAEERFMANLAFEMEDQIQMIDRRLEWMAAQALLTGTVTITGDGYASPILVNFMRDPTLTVALSGSAQWGQSGVSPSAYIETWATQVLQKSGAVVDKIVFTTSAWNAFKSDVNVLNAIWPPRAGGSTVNLGGEVKPGAVLKGTWGSYELWLYNEWFVDPVTDVETPMLPDGTVILASSQMEGTRAFGKVKDPRFNYQALAYAPKMWNEEDPAQTLLMMQSAPIVIPSRVNAAIAATVMAPGSGSVAPPI